MSGMTFDLSGLEELTQDLCKAQSLFPDEFEKSLKKMATNFAKEASKEAVSSGVGYDSESADLSWLSQKYWKKRYYNLSRLDAYIDITNASNVHHLVENGHVLLDKKKRTMGKGFVPGFHYTEKTRQRWENSEKLSEELNEVLKKTMSRVDL